MAIFRRRKSEDTAVFHSAADRFETVADGISTRHCFSAGAHYDPDRVGFGRLAGLDEHVLEPGAGFDWHAHRGVEILSWVLDGVLRHEDDSGTVLEVGPGGLLHQSAGAGIRHRETNASGTASLRFVQLTVLGETGAARVDRAATPLLLPGLGLFDVLAGRTILELSSAWVFVTAGSFNLTGMNLVAGDSVALSATTGLYGSGQALVWASPRAQLSPPTVP
jgi:hypothetical protein